MSRRPSRVGPVTRGPGTAGSTLPPVLHDTYGRVLAGLLERVLAGDLATDWVSVEREVVAALAALMQLHKQHQVGEQGRCLICSRVWWRWPRRAACIVHAVLAFHMPHVAAANLGRV